MENNQQIPFAPLFLDRWTDAILFLWDLFPGNLGTVGGRAARCHLQKNPIFSSDHKNIADELKPERNKILSRYIDNSKTVPRVRAQNEL